LSWRGSLVGESLRLARDRDSSVTAPPAQRVPNAGTSRHGPLYLWGWVGTEMGAISLAWRGVHHCHAVARDPGSCVAACLQHRLCQPHVGTGRHACICACAQEEAHCIILLLHCYRIFAVGTCCEWVGRAALWHTRALQNKSGNTVLQIREYYFTCART
jgi:hypothetical protein